MLLNLAWACCLSAHLATSLHLGGASTEATLDIFRRDEGNNYGDPVVGDPVTDLSCSIDNSGITKRDFSHSQLTTRAPSEPAPLKEPKSHSDEDWTAFIKSICNDPKDNSLLIWPSDEQTNSWTVDYGSRRNAVKIPIGATGVWFPFGDTAETYSMTGLTGCTAIIAVSSKGIYAGHLWEGSKEANGPASFVKPYLNTAGKKEYGERSSSEFKAVAVDIWGQQTPEAEKSKRPLWVSLADLKQDQGDPFGNGDDVRIFFLTKAKSEANAAEKYSRAVTQVRTKFNDLILGSSSSTATYWKAQKSTPIEVQGIIAVQYTPYEKYGGEDGCTPQARVRGFHENTHIADIDKSWNNPSAGTNNRRRGTCTTTSSATPTPAPTSDPVTTLEVKTGVCNKESDFSGHGDVGGSQQGVYAGQFCDGIVEKSKIISAGQGYSFTGTDISDIHYDYRITWIDGCLTTEEHVDVAHPLPQDQNTSCVQLLTNNYKNCDNGGVGGTIEVGCIRYSFDGALGSPPPCEGCTEIYTPIEPGAA